MVNKAVYHILSNDVELEALVGKKIHPIVMPENTQAPCLVFMTDSIVPEYVKGHGVIDNATVTIIIFSRDYVESVNILEKTRTALELKTGTFNGVQIQSSRIQKMEEGYDVESDTYFQKITSQIKTFKQ